MWKDSLVIDGVVHAYDWSPSNAAPGLTPEMYAMFTDVMWDQVHVATESRAPGYVLSLQDFKVPFTAEHIARVFIDETDIDMICYHEVQISGFFDRGTSPFQVGADLQREYPGRVLLYPFVDPFKGASELERMQERVENYDVAGFKFYPTDGVFDMETGRQHEVLYDDPEMAYPFFEKAQELGVNHIAIHKAFPVGPGPLTKDRVEDISTAACTFPNLTFEVVHSGWAFLEDCAMQLALHPNIYANLELTANFAVRRPRQFAHVLGTFLRQGPVEDRLLFASGIPNGHPGPVFDALVDMQMPEDLIEGEDYPAITDELKKKLFGLNYAKLHGIDVDAKLEEFKSDRWATERAQRPADAKETPWRAHRAAARELVGKA